MCAIIDANAIGEIFGSRLLGETGIQSKAGKQFFDWLDSKPERLVIGGSKLEKELNNKSYATWLAEVKRRVNLREYTDKEVDQKAKELRKQNACVSNDEHIIALAQISQARLLYSHDKCLHKDFKNEDLINYPKGKIFPTGDNPQDPKRRSAILAEKNLCKKK